MSNASSAQVQAYSVAARQAYSAALQKGLNVSTRPVVDVVITLPDPVTGTQKKQAVTVAFAAPTGTPGQVWLNVSNQTATFNQFLVYTTAWYVIPPASLVYNPSSVVGVAASNITANKTAAVAAVTGTVALTVTSSRLQLFSNTLTGNTTVTMPTTGSQDGMEFEVVRNAATPGAFTLTVSDATSSASYTIASNGRGFCRMRCIGAGGWVVVAAGTLP